MTIRFLQENNTSTLLSSPTMSIFAQNSSIPNKLNSTRILVIGVCADWLNDHKYPIGKTIRKILSAKYWPFRFKMVEFTDCEMNIDILFCRNINGFIKMCLQKKQQRSPRIYHNHRVGMLESGVQYNSDFSFQHVRGRPFVISFRWDSALGQNHTNDFADLTWYGQYFDRLTPNPQMYVCLGCLEVAGGERFNSTSDLTAPKKPFSNDLAKRKFMLYIVNSGTRSICHKIAHSWNVLLRTAVYDEFHERFDDVTSYGTCRKTEDEPIRPGYDLSTRLDGNSLQYGDFKFSLVFENDVKLGYLTEKMFNAYFGRSIPIYWGAPDVDEIINAERILHLKVSRKDITKAWKIYEQKRGSKEYYLPPDELETLFWSKHEFAGIQNASFRLRNGGWYNETQFKDVADGNWKGVDHVREIEDRIFFLRQYFQQPIGDLVAKIRYLHENEEEYMEKAKLPLLNQPLNGSEFDLQLIVKRILHVMQSAGSYLLSDEYYTTGTVDDI